MALTRTYALLRSVNLMPQSLSQIQIRLSNTLPNETIEKHRHSNLNHAAEKRLPQNTTPAPRHYKYVYPEFLPNPDYMKRDRVSELLQRRDMVRRRSVLDLPEFYVGSILAVTVSDPYAPGKKNRFVGLCIDRGGFMLRAFFVLRNIVDSQGVEIMYEMYNPTIQRVEVLKLEKRLDAQLYYLRDAPQDYSTFPFDMEVIPHPPGAPITVNQLQVRLGPVPWHDRWERKELKGAVLPPISTTRRVKAELRKTPWEKHDLMKQYRAAIDEEESEELMTEVYSAMAPVEKQHHRRKLMSTKK